MLKPLQFLLVYLLFSTSLWAQYPQAKVADNYAYVESSKRGLDPQYAEDGFNGLIFSKKNKWAGEFIENYKNQLVYLGFAYKKMAIPEEVAKLERLDEFELGQDALNAKKRSKQKYQLPSSISALKVKKLQLAGQITPFSTLEEWLLKNDALEELDLGFGTAFRASKLQALLEQPKLKQVNIVVDGSAQLASASISPQLEVLKIFPKDSKNPLPIRLSGKGLPLLKVALAPFDLNDKATAAVLAASPNLEELTLAESASLADGLALLQQIKSLRCQLSNLSSTEIEQLAKLGQLKELYIVVGNKSIAVSTLAEFKQLGQLKKLTIAYKKSSKKVKADSLKELQKALPTVEVQVF
ncbi:hypothetical protein [Saprospira grandis]|uniref:hypothetical protein n=1 Tax=Saprospira grandis TaxID=1008 RepID=UPI0022DDBEC8|nr:hypothetical protein [Saprospira grandis]WBM74209.1 hypothetical protein OP864_14570 [Saprospira grandis]